MCNYIAYNHLLSVLFFCAYLRSRLLIMSSTVWVRPVSSLQRTYSTSQLESYCVSRSSTTSPLTFEIDYTAARTAYRIQSVCPGVQVSASGCTNIPFWTVLTGVWISQSWTPPLCCAGWPCSATLQNNEIRSNMFCCLDQRCGTHSHCQFVTHHWHWLSSVRFWKLCYSAENTKH